jgi:hypothetical protein
MQSRKLNIVELSLLIGERSWSWKELPRNSPISGQQPFDVMGDIDVGAEADNLLSIPNMATKEGREERRRIWWLLYTADRHLALRYNKPTSSLEVE